MVVVARVLSYLFHPLLIPSYLFLLFAWLFPMGLSPIPASAHLKVIMLLLMVTFVLPILLLSILRSFGFIRSFHIHDRKERIFPAVLISLMYMSVTYMFYYQSRIDLNEPFMKTLMIIDMIVIVATLISIFYKVSLHSLTLWGVVGILVPLNKVTEFDSLFYPAIVSVLLAGIVMSSRLVLQVHTLKEVMWGAIAGLATGIAGMMIFF